MGARERALALHLKYPLQFVAFSRGFTSTHRGVDIAWNDEHGGPNMPIYAPADGTVVVAKDGMDNTYASGIPDWGNYVKIKHADGVYTLMAHMLKGSVCVHEGQIVKRGTQIGRMGNTGYSNGSHTHTEVYIGGSSTGYRANPVDYMFAWPDQDVHAGDKKEYGIKTYTPVKEVGNPVERNVFVDQIEVITDTLRARKEPNLNGEVLGYVKQGIYNIYNIQEADGYKWYLVEDFWCANDKEETWCKVMPSQFYGSPVSRNEKVDQFEVTATSLRARHEPSLEGEIYGFATPGVYNCIGIDSNDGYKWFKASDSNKQEFWAAQSQNGDWIAYYPKHETKYDLTMMGLNEAQKKAMTAWCKAEGVVYVVTEK